MWTIALAPFDKFRGAEIAYRWRWFAEGDVAVYVVAAVHKSLMRQLDESSTYIPNVFRNDGVNGHVCDFFRS
jgi:hypothetical protein